jgi:pyruvate,water dikinase
VNGAAVPLVEALSAARFGGKAAGLATALAHHLPVPDGVAIDADLVEALARGDARARSACAAAVESMLGGRVAVRSSAVGEDAASASFAGQHATRLGVATKEGVLGAILEVRSSAESDGAVAYRRRLGLPREARMAVVVQRMVDATCAGVMFTRSPIDGADERVIEAAWGLGEVVVAGRVVPDRFRLARSGALLASAPGDKDVTIELGPQEGTVERSLPADLRAAPCLDGARLAALAALAAVCDEAYGSPSDVEWAFEIHRREGGGGAEDRSSERLYLLQRRPVTR